MPVDNYDEDEDRKGGADGAKKKFKEFDCPSCSANNPSEGFGDGDEVLCNYCGSEYEVRVNDEGRVKFREK